MTTTHDAGPQGPGANELLRAMKSLTRPGMVACWSGGADQAARLTGQPEATAGAGSEPRRTIDAAAMREMVERGWAVEVEAASQAGRVAAGERAWRLSEAGRIRLKRALSRGETERPQPVPDRSAHEGSRRAASAAEGPGPALPGAVDSPLAWLARHKDRTGKPYLAPHEIEAGARLASDFEKGAMTPSITSRWSPIGAGGGAGPRADRELLLQDAALGARERVRRALAAVGPELSGLLLDVCCHLRGLEEIERANRWAVRSGKVVLRVALAQLARHYGIRPRT
ncbi:MAG: DUF6456 domain-containing protein [Hyphomicrobiaceae bacterium]|nr:DUF6456 domain-containing protein [Hyphomicrobiaceae bacterium]